MEQKCFAIELTTLGPFRIGGKTDPLSEADNPVTVVGGRVCIPGPTLKGAYRAELERWLNDEFNKGRGWNHESLQPCVPSSRLSNDEEQLVSSKKYKGGNCMYKSDSGKNKQKDQSAAQSKTTVCPVCYLLGAMGLVGFVNVPFLFTDVRYEGLYSTRLDRVSFASMGGNRPYQLVPPQTVFEGTLEVLVKDDFLGWELGKPRPLKEIPNADEWLKESKPNNEESWNSDYILKVMIKERLEAIQRLGGYRSKGFGKVKIEVKEIQS